MLFLLTDEHVSPVTAEHVRLKRPDIRIYSLHRWQEGAFLGKADRLLLAAAHTERLTLLTYDQKTIPPLLLEMASDAADHSGVVFVDNETIAQHDIGGLIRAILLLYDRCSVWEWTNRVSFLASS
jgi:hypothetical protein